ncbi:sensor protein LytS [Siminovitchia terrae]|uniref:LytS/YhcK type 5TM receptor domain-containing protein n=1 Tax=Siminovitchia terrae TaxID=1914933 RepID=UPI001B0B26CB|nr:LytS/YhcK type 5TM receptor domain-containing protein [Siminovitchia terrae]GIN89669.1 sensor protein LytS [Siminovitchia terrae]
MFELFITMMERLGIIVTIAFILTRFQFFRNMIYLERLDRKQQLTAIFFFGFFGIIGTYTGLRLSTETLNIDRWVIDLSADEAIANSRVIGIVIAGMLGGYRVGIGAALIAAIHRFTLGGFTAFSCGLATIFAGVLAGMFHKKNKQVKLRSAFKIGALAETIQMLIILLISRPFEKALALVEVIGMPMIIANGLGCALFLLIIKNVINEEEKAVALQAQKILRIADQTLVHLRNGITISSARAVCQIIHNDIQTSAVAMTNLTDILAHAGVGEDHRREGPVETAFIKDAIKKGKIVVGQQKTGQYREKGNQFGATVIAPLKIRGDTVGTLIFYFRSEKEVTHVVMELISGLSMIISNQLEMAEADKAYQLAKEAEIISLQAQISPHFLFNTLNTVISLIRNDPSKARKLLVSLSHFLRQNLSVTTNNMTTLEQELKHTKAYLSIEQARFVDKLEVFYDIDEDVLLHSIPPITLQPLVENAVKHGFKNKERDCMLNILIRKDDRNIYVTVEDNGDGMSEERRGQIGMAPIESKNGNGLALYNVNRRLMMTFGKSAALKISSSAEKGTSVAFSIENEEEAIGNGQNHKSDHCR